MRVKWQWCYKSIQRYDFYSLAEVLPHLTSFGPWASPYGENGQITMAVHIYRPRQVHEALNGLHSSNGFRDLHSVWTQFVPKLTSFWSMGKPIWGKWPYQCTTAGLDNSTELRAEKIHQAVTEIWVPQVWQPPARPDRDNNAPQALKRKTKKTRKTKHKNNEVIPLHNCISGKNI